MGIELDLSCTAMSTNDPIVSVFCKLVALEE
jgi:hypothetical protein